MEQEYNKTVNQTEGNDFIPNTGKPKKNLKWLWITIFAVLGAGIIAWCGYSAYKASDFFAIFDFSSTTIKGEGVSTAYSVIGVLLGLFFIIALGSLLGRITIKGVSLGTSGVFLVAILFGYLFTLIPSDMPILGVLSISSTKDLMNVIYSKIIQNIGLVLFVGAVGCIAGPKFFRNFKTNAKSYVLLGAVIIVIGAVVTALFALLPSVNADFAAGVMSGALTSTPGYSAAKDAAGALGEDMVTLGYAIAYPFGVVGVVLFVQLLPKLLKADMNKERALLLTGAELAKKEEKKGLLNIDDYGIGAFAIAAFLGIILGSIKIPLSAKGYADGSPCFSLGNTGGILIMGLILGHFGKIGKISLRVPEKTLKVSRELGLTLFLAGSGVSGGVSLVSQVKAAGGAMIVVYGLLGGILVTLVPMIVGYIIARYCLKLPLLNNLGSITGGMTSTPALGTLIGVAETDDVAAAYASTYPIALVLVVFASQLIVTLL